jgi:transketolase
MLSLISISHYGASAAGAMLFEEFGFSGATVVAAANESIAASGQTTAPTHSAASGSQGPADTVADPGVTIS